MKKIYLDTNILVALLAEGKNLEGSNRKIINNALKIFSKLSNVKLLTSIWTITEMAKVLINEKKMSNKIVASIVNEFVNTNKLGEFKVGILEVHPKKGYKFNNFFDDVREKMILYNPGWGDAIHSVIMKNNNINEILTLDDKKDFKIIPKIIVIDPKDIVLSDFSLLKK
jgi:predicted nucleic acid-binding protein